MLVLAPLMVEYEAVLKRPEHLDASGLNANDVDEILNAVAKIAVPVTSRFLWRPRLKDPADEMVLKTAVNGRAGRLVTFDERHLAAPASEFGIRVITPGKVWDEARRADRGRRIE